MTKVSGKIKDIQPGRVLELVEIPGTDGRKARKATAFVVTGVRRFRSAIEVTGVKLDRAGNPHRSGKEHTVDAVEGEFRVSWNEDATVVTTDNVQHADDTNE